MSNDDYFAKPPAGDGDQEPPAPGQPDPTAGQPSPYAAPGQPDPYAAQPNPYAAPGQADPYAAPGQYGTPGYGSPGYGTPAPGAPGYGAQAYGAPAYGTPPTGYGNPAYGYPYAPPQTNGLAIAAMIVSLVSLVSCWPVGLAGAIMGHLARKQIAQRNEQGGGMALTGIIVGWILVALSVVVALFFLLALPWSGSEYSN